MKNGDISWRRYKVQETLYKGQWHLSPFQVGTYGSLSSPSISSTIQNTLQNPLLELLPAALLYFPESHRWSEISSLSKAVLVLGKVRGDRAPNLGCSGAEPPGRFDVSPKTSAWDMMHELAHCCDEAANHHFPIVAAIFCHFTSLNQHRTLR